MATVELAETASNREVLLWTVVYPAAVVLPLFAVSLVYAPATVALIVVAAVAAVGFGLMGEDFRAQAMLDRAYHHTADTARGDDDNPDERIGSLNLLRFTGGLASGSLLALVAVGFTL